MYYKRAGSDDQDRAVGEDLTPSEFRAAELGYFGLLRRKGISPQFIDRYGEELFQQACFEYTRMIRAGKEVRKPVAWIVLCAWSRTKRVMEQPNWRPRMISIDSVGELSGRGASAPEEDLLSEDRHRKVREAVEHLPEYQRELLSVAYFEDMGVREAARKLGWHPSKAQRAHEAAQRALHRLLGVETSEELEIAAGLAAFLTFGPDGCDRIPQLIGGFEAAVDAVGHHLHRFAEHGVDLLRRPFVHRGSGGLPSPPDRTEALGDLGRRALAGAPRGPASLAGRGGRRVSDLGRRMFASGALETTTAAADGGTRFAEACKIAAVCLVGTGAIAGGSALLGSEQHHRPAPAAVRPVASSHQKPAEAPVRVVQEPDPTPSIAPAGPRERHADNTTSGSRPESSNSVAAARPEPNRAQRRVQDHQTAESTAESTFEAGQIAAAEEEARRSSSGSGATSGTGSTLSESGGSSQAATTAPTSPKVQTEEEQTRTQFQGGLP